MNGFRKKLLGWKQRLSDRHMYSIVLTIVAIVAAVGIYQYKRAVDFRNEAHNQYNRAFFELVDAVSNVEVSLSKSMLVNSSRQMTDLSSETWRYATFAQADLGQLPIQQSELENTSKFLSQVGAYTYSLSRKSQDGAPVTNDDFAQLGKLQDYAKTLSDSLIAMRAEVTKGTIRFGDVEKAGKQTFGSEKSTMSENIGNIKDEFQDYPSLIYDGPFSDKIAAQAPRMLTGKPELSADDAKKKAAEFLGPEKSANLTLNGESDGDIKEYQFTDKIDDKRNITISVSKVGGIPIWLLDNRSIPEAKLTVPEAVAKAGAFLAQKGYNSMKESYYVRSDNMATINFAYMEKNIIMYPDLVKVKIALDNGEVVGFESRSYITGHLANRDMPKIKLTEAQARAKINSRLKISNVRLAVIPSDSEQELLCYEFKGELKDRNFLVYINVANGREEKILLLIETPDGVLTM